VDVFSGGGAADVAIGDEAATAAVAEGAALAFAAATCSFGFAIGVGAAFAVRIDFISAGGRVSAAGSLNGSSNVKLSLTFDGAALGAGFAAATFVSATLGAAVAAGMGGFAAASVGGTGFFSTTGAAVDFGTSTEPWLITFSAFAGDGFDTATVFLTSSIVGSGAASCGVPLVTAVLGGASVASLMVGCALAGDGDGEAVVCAIS
jgi:hypothetical protein